MKKILIINGPNLNMLGKRESQFYGTLTLEQIKAYTEDKLADRNVGLTWWQSNSEAEMIERLHKLVSEDYDYLIINPAAFSHTSLAVLDALRIISIPIAEVHLSNVYNREPFRHSMLTAQASSMIMSGLGKNAYHYAAMALMETK